MALSSSKGKKGLIGCRQKHGWCVGGAVIKGSSTGGEFTAYWQWAVEWMENEWLIGCGLYNGWRTNSLLAAYVQKYRGRMSGLLTIGSRMDIE